MHTDNKKKIAMVVQRYGLEVNGGAELECRLYAERLTPFYDVTILTTCAVDHYTWADSYKPGEEMINGVRVMRFPVDYERKMEEFAPLHGWMMAGKHSPEEETKWLLSQGPVSKKLIKYITAQKDAYECFVFMTYLYHPTVAGVSIVPGKSVLIPTAHDEPPIYLSIFREVFKKPKAIFYNTLSEQIFVNTMFDNASIRSEIGGAGVDLPENIDASTFRQRFGINGPYIVYVGRIEEGKGCQDLFKLLDFYNKGRLKNRLPPLTLVMVGKAAMKIPERPYVKPLGFVSENDKYAAIMESSFLVLPSHFESLSIVVLEAFRLGKPVLVNGTCEVLRDHCRISNGGFYYQTPDEFCAFTDYLLENTEVAAQMGRNGQRYQKEYYTWEHIIQKLSSLIEYASNKEDQKPNAKKASTLNNLDTGKKV